MPAELRTAGQPQNAPAAPQAPYADAISATPPLAQGTVMGFVANAEGDAPLAGVGVVASGVFDEPPRYRNYLPMLLKSWLGTAPALAAPALPPLTSGGVFTATTATDGSFALAVPAGTYTLTLTLANFTPDRRSAAVRANQVTRVADVRLHALDPVVAPIGAAGGTVSNSLSNTSLQFPAGAVSQTVQSRVTYLPNQALPGFFPDGSIPMGFANLEPEGLVLPQGKEVLWTVAYTGTMPVGTDTLCYWWDGTQARWRDPVPGKIVDAGTGKRAIQARVHHFSQYGHALPGIAGQQPTGGQATVTNANAGQGRDQTDCNGCQINVGTGSVAESYAFLPISGTGFPVILAARYSSSNDTPAVTARVPFTITTQVPARSGWRLEFQGKVYTGEGYDARASWDTRNALGQRVAPGLYPYSAVETFYYDSGARPSLAVSGTVEVRRGDVWPFGFNWMTSYDELLVDNSTTVTIVQGDGQYRTYTRNPDKGYSPPAGDYSRLAHNADGSWTRTSKYGVVESFDVLGRLIRIQNANGSAHVLGYEPSGVAQPPGAWGPSTRLKSITDASGRAWTFSYGTDHYVNCVTDPTGRQYTLTHDAAGNLTGITDPLGRITAYEYDRNHLLERTTNPEGNSTTLAYDNQGRLVSHKNALGNDRITTFGPETTTLVNERGIGTTYSVNAYGAVTRASNPVQTFNYIYDEQRRLSSSNPPLERFTYDDRGNVTEYRSYTVVTATYEAQRNRLTAITDPSGNITQLAHDASGNLTQVIDAQGNTQRFDYDGAGQIIRAVDPLDHASQFEYDAFGNLLGWTDPLGFRTAIGYDAAGNLNQFTDPESHRSTFGYDVADRLTSVTDPLDRITHFEYDRNDNLKRVVDARGKITVYSYDAMNQLTEERDPLGNTTKYSYDPAGNLGSITEANGVVTQYTYDAANRLIGIQYPGSALAYGYDSTDNLTDYLDAGVQITYSYPSLIPASPDVIETRTLGNPAISSRITYDYATSAGTALMATAAREAEPGPARAPAAFAPQQQASGEGASAPAGPEASPPLSEVSLDQGATSTPLPAPTSVPGEGVAQPRATLPGEPYAEHAYGEQLTPQGTIVGGLISANTTWALAGSPYIVGTASVTVAPGVTLTIEPGVVVKVDHWSKSIVVNGSLMADADAAHPIVFTSYKDDTVAGDTNGDGSATQPAPGDWGSLQFAPSSTENVLDYVVARYGGPGTGANVIVNTTAISLTNSTFTRSYYGLLLNNALPPLLKGNSFISNTNCAVNAPLTNNAGSMTLRGNTATGNAVNGFCTGGAVSGSPAWDGDPDFPFVLNGDLTVNAGAKLTLAPGTIVKLNHWSRRVTVNGTLIADGDETHPILFTSIADDEAGGDTNNNGPTPPLPREWNAVRLEAGSTGSVLDHVKLGYGGANSGANVIVNTTSVTLTNNSFFRGDTGLLLNNALLTVISANSFISNTNCAINAPLTNNAGSIALRGNTATGNATNGVCIGGTVSGSPTWDGDPGLPFVLTGDLTVNAGATLTLAPGTIVKLNHWSRQVLANGALIARGDAARPIVFTSVMDDSIGGDTNSDHGSAPPAAGNWRSVRFAATSAGSVLDYVTARYGGSQASGEGCVHLNTSDITLTNSTIAQCEYGLSVSGASPAVTGNTFTANKRGVFTASGAKPVLRRNRIAGNTEWGVYNSDPSVIVDAVQNSWGSTTGPNDPSDDRASGGWYNPGGEGDRVTDHVDYEPWLLVSGLVYGVSIATGSNSVQTIRYDYDPLNRLRSLVASGLASFAHQYSYDPSGRLVATGAAPGNPGITTTLQFDAGSRPTHMINRSPDGSVTFNTLEYTYDKAGRLLTALDAGGATSYTYDALGQLKSAVGPGFSETYTYDEVGNRLSKNGVTSVYDDANELMSSSDGTTYTYDKNGNLLTKSKSGQTTTYAWDAENRLTRIEFPDGTYAAYTYDNLGHRVSRRDRAGTTTYFSYDGANLVQEVSSAGEVVASYVHDSLDHPLSMTRGGATYYCLFDRLGSVVGLTDGAGGLIVSYRYDPWGNLISSGGANPELANPFRFTGREWDAESGLYYSRARYYDPAAGRFLSRDPARGRLYPPNSHNPYTYVYNDPVNAIDPSGTQGIGIAEAIALGVVVLVVSLVAGGVIIVGLGTRARKNVDGVTVVDWTSQKGRDFVSGTEVAVKGLSVAKDAPPQSVARPSFGASSVGAEANLDRLVRGSAQVGTRVATAQPPCPTKDEGISKRWLRSISEWFSAKLEWLSDLLQRPLPRRHSAREPAPPPGRLGSILCWWHLATKATDKRGPRDHSVVEKHAEEVRWPVNIIERGMAFRQWLVSLAQRTGRDWKQCASCGSSATCKWGRYARNPWFLTGRRRVWVQRHYCRVCDKTYAEQSGLLIRGSWYAREVHRCAIDHWQHLGTSLRRTAEVLRSWMGHQERWRMWRPLDSEEGQPCYLAASTVQRWLDGAGQTAQASVDGQLSGISHTQVVGTDGLWAKLKGRGQRVVLLVVDSLSGLIYPPIVAQGEEAAGPWQRLFERAQQAGLDLSALRGVTSDGAQGLLAYLRRGLTWVQQQRCVWHLWRNLDRELAHAADRAGAGLSAEAASQARQQARAELGELIHRIIDAQSYEQAEAALATLLGHPLGATIGQLLNQQLDRVLVHLLDYYRGLQRVTPEWYWRDFRLRLSHGRNHGSDPRLERAALVWAIYHNFEPAQWRSERQRHYRHPGQSALQVAGVPPGQVSYLDALGV